MTWRELMIQLLKKKDKQLDKEVEGMMVQSSVNVTVSLTDAELVMYDDDIVLTFKPE